MRRMPRHYLLYAVRRYLLDLAGSPTTLPAPPIAASWLTTHAPEKRHLAQCATEIARARHR